MSLNPNDWIWKLLVRTPAAIGAWRKSFCCHVFLSAVNDEKKTCLNIYSLKIINAGRALSEVTILTAQ